MKILTVFGASDDCIEFSGIEGADEFYRTGYGEYAGLFCISSQGFAMSQGWFGTQYMLIHCIYDGSWSFAISAGLDEILPPWKITRTWGNNSDYSETVEIEVPDDTILSRRI